MNGNDKLVQDFLGMLTSGSSNDVKLILEDGEILANKDVLSARCVFFATCFSNRERNFEEGETNTVDLSHCSKLIMEKIVNYLFSGKIEFQDLSLTELIKMMNMASMLLLDELLTGLQVFVLGFLSDTGVNCGSIPDLVEGLILVEQFKLVKIKENLVIELYRSLMDVPHLPDVVKNSGAFKRLPVNLLKDVLFCVTWCCEGDVPSTKNELDAFMFWLSDNEIGEGDKMEIAKHFEFYLQEFTAEELLTDVKKSGLFSMKMIDDRVMEILQEKDRKLKAKDETITKKRKEVDILKEENKKLKKDLAKEKLLTMTFDKLIKHTRSNSVSVSFKNKKNVSF